MHYGGKYLWPDDIGSLYGEVDLVCAGFPVSNVVPANWQWARTNRFYEACCFGRPMVVLKGGGDEAQVRQLDIGTSIEFANTEKAVRQLDSITWSDLTRWRENAIRLDESTFVEVDESDRLLSALRDLTAGEGR